jgi:hypothetical protein
MLQRYIHVPADPSIIVKTYRAPSHGVTTMGRPSQRFLLPDLVLGVLSCGGAVAYEAARPSAGIEEGEPPASMRGALGGLQRGCAHSLPLSPSEQLEQFAMDLAW